MKKARLNNSFWVLGDIIIDSTERLYKEIKKTLCFKSAWSGILVCFSTDWDADWFPV